MRHTALIATIFLSLAAPLFASQPLETESARLLPAGVFKIEAATELQTSKEGHETAFPIAFEYGLTSRLELAVEPVPLVTITPKHGAHARGPGDTEVTLTWRAIEESARMPAIAVAGEVKFPTAHNILIGTGKRDYTALFIASKRSGRLDTHVNLGYTAVGSPAGANLGNIVDYAFAQELHIQPRFDVVWEVIGNTSSSGESADGTSTVTPEAAGGERSALIGFRYALTKPVTLAVGVSYDSNHAVLLRTGLTFRFGGK
jgi:hypothetical protein